LGIQSVYDSVLKDIERGHTTKQTKDSLRTLRDLGFKVAAHYMPGLPGVDAKKDLAGMKKLFSCPDYKPDMLKIYPCMVLRGTKLYQRYLEGKFNPLTVEQAAKLIAQFKPNVPEYCRIMRIQRDIPETQIETGAKMTNLRQYLMQNYNVKCRCIRCREPKDQKINWSKVKIKVQKYPVAQGTEFFISAEDSTTDTLIGFVRMRYPSQALRAEITKDSALIRELHVYGQAAALGETGEVQHRGWGKRLMHHAEQLAKRDRKKKMIVISGIGVREYYRRLGYRLEGPYMVKKI
jgi:elongator complex protein 3